MDSLKVVRSLVYACAAGSLLPSAIYAQSPALLPGQVAGQVAGQSAQSRLRPLGTPSAVDAFASSVSSVRQVAMMQSVGDGQPMRSPALPPSGFVSPGAPFTGGPGALPPAPLAPGGFTLPPSSSLPAPPQTGPSSYSPPALPNPNLNVGAPLPSTPNYGQTTAPPPARYVQPGVSVPTSVPRASNDYAAVPAPQLENAFATIDNCRNISAPSPYRAAGVFGCGTPVSYGSPVYGPPVYGSAPATYVPPPSQIAPAIGYPSGPPLGVVGSMPPVLPGNPGYRPLISFGQEANPVQVGQGLLGQPVAYVPGQRVRNALRYISF